MIKNIFKYTLMLMLVLVFIYQLPIKEIQGVVQSEKKRITSVENKEVKRFGMVIGLKPDKVDEYKKLHKNAWPGVLKQLEESYITNYSIFLQNFGSKYYLFSYYEYVGNNYEQDMEKVASDSVVQAWWEITESYQIPLPSRKEGAWWTQMEEVFHFKRFVK